MGIQKILAMMRQTPFRQDGTSTGYDASQAARCQWNILQANAGMDGEVIDPLLRLFYQGIAENLPGEFFGLAIDFFERLINGHCADRHRRIANDPFARFMDEASGGKIHDRIRAPAGGPCHLLDLLFDRGTHCGIADIGIDLHQEISADDHRL